MTKEVFWNWFDEHKNLLELLVREEYDDYDLYEELSAQLQEYNEFLIPEITINENNDFVLIISCDGNAKGIPFVNELTQDIKKFERWEIVKFRQPGAMEFIPLNGKDFKRRNIFLKWDKLASGKYYINFFIKQYSQSNPDYEISTLLHMDHTIGEYNSMTKIEGIKMNKLGFFQSKKGLKDLDDLYLEIQKNFG
jgi:hypothetical protein